MFWSVGPFWYMVYGIWYVVYGMKMVFIVYSHMFRMHHAWAAYNIVHLFLVKDDVTSFSFVTFITRTNNELMLTFQVLIEDNSSYKSFATFFTNKK